MNTRARPQETLRTSAPHILLVENDPAYAIQLMNNLKDWRLPLTDSSCMIDIASDIDRAREYLRQDSVDLFIVDLIMHKSSEAIYESKDVGQEFAREVWATSNAGIIVHTTLSEDDGDASVMLKEGVDDYIRKGTATIETIQARIQALWRRIQLIRPSTRSIHAHANRVFIIGDWKFTVGNRILTNATGEVIKLSPTEHAFLRHVCTSENNECNKVDFNIAVLGRRAYEENMRVDNFVYRLRQKMGRSLELLSDEGTYRLIDVRELKST